MSLEAVPCVLKQSDGSPVYGLLIRPIGAPPPQNAAGAGASSTASAGTPALAPGPPSALPPPLPGGYQMVPSGPPPPLPQTSGTLGNVNPSNPGAKDGTFIPAAAVQQYQQSKTVSSQPTSYPQQQTPPQVVPELPSTSYAASEGPSTSEGAHQPHGDFPGHSGPRQGRDGPHRPTHQGRDGPHQPHGDFGSHHGGDMEPYPSGQELTSLLDDINSSDLASLLADSEKMLASTDCTLLDSGQSSLMAAVSSAGYQGSTSGGFPSTSTGGPSFPGSSSGGPSYSEASGASFPGPSGGYRPPCRFSETSPGQPSETSAPRPQLGWERNPPPPPNPAAPEQGPPPNPAAQQQAAPEPMAATPDSGIQSISGSPAVSGAGAASPGQFSPRLSRQSRRSVPPTEAGPSGSGDFGDMPMLVAEGDKEEDADGPSGTTSASTAGASTSGGPTSGPAASGAREADVGDVSGKVGHMERRFDEVCLRVLEGKDSPAPPPPPPPKPRGRKRRGPPAGFSAPQPSSVATKGPPKVAEAANQTAVASPGHGKGERPLPEPPSLSPPPPPLPSAAAPSDPVALAKDLLAQLEPRQLKALLEEQAARIGAASTSGQAASGQATSGQAAASGQATSGQASSGADLASEVGLKQDGPSSLLLAQDPSPGRKLPRQLAPELKGQARTSQLKPEASKSQARKQEAARELSASELLQRRRDKAAAGGSWRRQLELRKRLEAHRRRAAEVYSARPPSEVAELESRLRELPTTEAASKATSSTKLASQSTSSTKLTSERSSSTKPPSQPPMTKAFQPIAWAQLPCNVRLAAAIQKARLEEEARQRRRAEDEAKARKKAEDEAKAKRKAEARKKADAKRKEELVKKDEELRRLKEEKDKAKRLLEANKSSSETNKSSSEARKLAEAKSQAAGSLEEESREFSDSELPPLSPISSAAPHSPRPFVLTPPPIPCFASPTKAAKGLASSVKTPSLVTSPSKAPSLLTTSVKASPLVTGASMTAKGQTSLTSPVKGPTILAPSKPAPSTSAKRTKTTTKAETKTKKRPSKPEELPREPLSLKVRLSLDGLRIRGREEALPTSVLERLAETGPSKSLAEAVPPKPKPTTSQASLPPKKRLKALLAAAADQEATAPSVPSTVPVAPSSKLPLVETLKEKAKRRKRALPYPWERKRRKEETKSETSGLGDQARDLKRSKGILETASEKTLEAETRFETPEEAQAKPRLTKTPSSDDDRPLSALGRADETASTSSAKTNLAFRRCGGCGAWQRRSEGGGCQTCAAKASGALSPAKAQSKTSVLTSPGALPVKASGALPAKTASPAKTTPKTSLPTSPPAKKKFLTSGLGWEPEAGSEPASPTLRQVPLAKLEAATPFRLPYDLWAELRGQEAREAVGKIGPASSKTSPTGSKIGNTAVVKSSSPTKPKRPRRPSPHNASQTPCRCSPTSGCGADCLNRSLFTQCDPAYCPCGEGCTNRHFGTRGLLDSLEKFSTGSARGQGVRTLSRIPKGAFVCEYEGRRTSAAAFAEKMSTIYKDEPHHYALNLHQGTVLDAYRSGNITRLVNHSCVPNCGMEKWSVGGEWRMGLFALRDLHQGEELTYDYKFRWFERSQTCLCGEAECRGTIGVVAKPPPFPPPPLGKRERGAVHRSRRFLLRNYDATRRVLLSGRRKPSLRALRHRPDEPKAKTPSAQLIVALRHVLDAFRGPPGLPEELAAGDVKELSARLLSGHYTSPKAFVRALLAAGAPPQARIRLRVGLQGSRLDELGFSISALERLVTSAPSSGGTSGSGDALLTTSSDLSYIDDGTCPVGSYDPDAVEWADKAAEGEEEEDQVRCVCGIPEEEGAMVACDACAFWQHQDCVGPPPSDTDFLCAFCRALDGVEEELDSDKGTSGGTCGFGGTSGSSGKSSEAGKSGSGSAKSQPSGLEKGTSGGTSGSSSKGSAKLMPSAATSGATSGSSGKPSEAAKSGSTKPQPSSLGADTSAAAKSRKTSAHQRVLSASVLLEPQPAIALKGCAYYRALLSGRGLQCRIGEAVYVERRIGQQHKDTLRRFHEECVSGEKAAKETKPAVCGASDFKVAKPASAETGKTGASSKDKRLALEASGAAAKTPETKKSTEALPKNSEASGAASKTAARKVDGSKRLYSRHDLRIFRIERLFTASGAPFVFGWYYARPHETFCEPTRRFHRKELFQTPLYDTLPLDAVVGRCAVLDAQTFTRGVPSFPALRPSDVYVCELRVDKAQRLFEKLGPKSRTPTATAAHVFRRFADRAKFRRDFTPFVYPLGSGGASEGRSAPLEDAAALAEAREGLRRAEVLGRARRLHRVLAGRRGVVVEDKTGRDKPSEPTRALGGPPGGVLATRSGVAVEESGAKKTGAQTDQVKIPSEPVRTKTTGRSEVAVGGAKATGDQKAEAEPSKAGLGLAQKSGAKLSSELRAENAPNKSDGEKGVEGGKLDNKKDHEAKKDPSGAGVKKLQGSVAKSPIQAQPSEVSKIQGSISARKASGSPVALAKRSGAKALGSASTPQTKEADKTKP